MDLQDQHEQNQPEQTVDVVDTQEQVQGQTTGDDQPEQVQPVPTGQIFVKSLSGETICIDYRPELTISELKNTIQSQLQIPVDQQRLIHQGKQLEDTNTLTDYNIAPNSTVHLVLRVKGGD